MKIEADEFKVFAPYIRSLCGLVLDDSKAYLIKTRLNGLAQDNGCSSFSELYYKARSDLSKALPRQIIDAITTNETLFFRDSAPFEMLQHKILPELIDRRRKKPILRRPSPCASGAQPVPPGRSCIVLPSSVKKCWGM